MKAPETRITYLAQDELRCLVTVIEGKRDKALFYLVYHHGLRASEVSLLQRADIQDKQGRIYIHRVKGSVSKAYPMQPEDMRRMHTRIPARLPGRFAVSIRIESRDAAGTAFLLGFNAEVW